MRKNSIKNTRINGEVMRELSNIIRGYGQRVKKRRGLYPHAACKKFESAEYAGNPFYFRSVDRVWN